jgi:hypothetical protein
MDEQFRVGSRCAGAQNGLLMGLRPEGVRTGRANASEEPWKKAPRTHVTCVLHTHSLWKARA